MLISIVGFVSGVGRSEAHEPVWRMLLLQLQTTCCNNNSSSKEDLMTELRHNAEFKGEMTVGMVELYNPYPTLSFYRRLSSERNRKSLI